MIVDITTRKQAENKLKASEKRFTLAMNATNDGLFDWNLETNEIYYSPGWKKMLGYEDHELPNDFSIWENLTEPEDVKKSWELQQKLIAKQIERFAMEFKMKHKNGHWVDILSRAEAIFNNEGKAVRMIGTHTDITDRKNAEEEIRKKDIEFRKLSANVPGMIFQFIRKPDGSYSVPLSSEGIESIFGCKPEDVLDDFTPIAKAIHFEDAERVLNEIEYSARNLTHFICEFRVQLPGKKIQWIFARSTPELQPDGSIIWYGFNIDITERKQIEESLKESEGKYRLLHENAGIGIGYYKPDGVIISFNKIAAMHLGGVPEDFEGKSIYDIFPKEEADFYFSRIKKTTIANAPTVYEDRVPLPKEDKYFLSTFSKITDSNNEIIGIQIISQDISEQKNTENELLKTRSLLVEAERIANVGSWDWNFKTNESFWSDQLFEIYGRKKEDGVPKYENYLEQYHPDDRSKLLETINKVISGEEEYFVEFRIYRYSDRQERIIQSKGEVLLADVLEDPDFSMAAIISEVEAVAIDKNLRDMPPI